MTEGIVGTGPDPIRDCKHGRLKRKCEECDMEKEIEILRGHLAEAQKRLKESESSEILALRNNEGLRIRIADSEIANKELIEALRKIAEGHLSFHECMAIAHAALTKAG